MRHAKSLIRLAKIGNVTFTVGSFSFLVIARHARRYSRTVKLVLQSWRLGSRTVKFRLAVWLYGLMTYQFGDWNLLSFGDVIAKVDDDCYADNCGK